MSEIATGATEAPQQQQSYAEQQRARLEAMVEHLDRRKAQLATLLQDAGIAPQQFTEVFRRALMKDPDLLKCDAGSLIQACIDAATDGLLPDGRQAVILVRNVNISPRGQAKQWVKKAVYQSMYQGLLSVAYRSGNFRKIEARVVYEGDEFDYALGDRPFIHHKPAKREAQRGDNPLATARPIVNAYAIAETVNGGVFREVFEEDDIRKVNAVSAATNGPGKHWPEEMARKGVVRRLWKYLPKTPAMERIAERDDQVFDIEIEDAEVAPKRIAPGFQPRLVHDKASQPMDVIAPEVGEKEPVAVDHEGEDAPPAERQADAPEDAPSAADEPAAETKAREPDAPSPAVRWAQQLREDLEADGFEDAATLDAFTSEPGNISLFEAYAAEHPEAAKALNAAIRGKRKALADRERG